MSGLNVYWFPGNAELTSDLRSDFVPDGDAWEMVAMIGDATLHFGSLGGRPAAILESAGETAFVVYEPFAEPFQPGTDFFDGEDF